MDTHCQRCQHPWTSHGADGCTFHQGGAICHCMISNDAEAYRARTPVVTRMLELQDTVRKLDAENNERFSRETEYQNRIRTLEARVLELEQVIRDIRYYAERKL